MQSIILLDTATTVALVATTLVLLVVQMILIAGWLVVLAVKKADFHRAMQRATIGHAPSRADAMFL